MMEREREREREDEEAPIMSLLMMIGGDCKGCK